MLHTVNEALTLMRERSGRRLTPSNDCNCKHCVAVEVLFLTATQLDDLNDPTKAEMTQSLVRFVYEWSKDESLA